jgi:hypothetical protein
MKRPVTETERALVRRMAEKLPETTRAQVLSDLNDSEVEPFNQDDSIVRFHIRGYRRPPNTGLETLPVFGKVLDRDGAHVEVALFGDANGRLYELELIRYEEGNLIGPDWNALELY